MSRAQVKLADIDTRGGELQPYELDDAEAVIRASMSAWGHVSLVQRKLGIRYSRAAAIVERLEQSGVISRAGRDGSRRLLR